MFVIGEPSHSHAHVVALTAWKSDLAEDQWKAVLTQTFTTMRNMLGDHCAQDAITTMWGRSLRGHHGQANEATAVSVQVHATVTKEAFLPLLSKSGFCKIYANTQPESLTQLSGHWIPGDLAQVTTAAATTQQCCGLVKGKNSFGLRFASDAFPAAWQKINPNTPMPQHAGGEYTYKIEPLPFGLTGKNIQQCASLYSWHIQPIKAVGPKSWIVSTAQHPVDQLMLFNSQPIIARILPPRTQTRHQSVLAGPKPQRGQGKGP